MKSILVGKNFSNSPIRKYIKNKENKSFFELEEIRLEEIDKIVDLAEKSLENSLKLVILGEVKAGKSTLINALLRKEIAYTNVVEATASVVEISYSEKEICNIVKNDGSRLEFENIEDLNKYMNTNKESQEFFEDVSKVQIATNIERLKNIVIVDTPGLATVTEANANRTENYIANSDFVIWTLNAHHLGQSDINDKIESVSEYGKPIVAVINRIDEIDGTSEEAYEYVDLEMGYMFSNIFCVSAKKAWDGYTTKNRKLADSSNIDELFNFLQNEIENNADEVQLESTKTTIETQLIRDNNLHKKSKERLEELIGSIEADITEANKFNSSMKQEINNRVDEWFDTKFFKDELNILASAENKTIEAKIKEFTNPEYLLDLVNTEYTDLNKVIFDKWSDHNNLYAEKQREALSLAKDLNYKLDLYEGDKNGNSITDNAKEGAVKGLTTGGAIGVGMAGYAAWLGPAAAAISIEGALMAFFHQH